MTPSLSLVLLIGALVAAGTYLMTSRSVARAIMGVLLLGNGVNLLVVTAGGPPGAPPIVGAATPEEMADPLPQAMTLTAIVIGLGFAAFLLAMAHRLWQITGSDVLDNDVDDEEIRAAAEDWDAARHPDAPGIDTTPDDADDPDDDVRRQADPGEPDSTMTDATAEEARP